MDAHDDQVATRADASTSWCAQLLLAADNLPLILTSLALLSGFGCLAAGMAQPSAPWPLLGAIAAPIAWLIAGFSARGTGGEARLVRQAFSWRPLSRDPGEVLGRDAARLLAGTGVPVTEIAFYRTPDGVPVPVATGLRSIGLPPAVLAEIDSGEAQPEIIAAVVAHEYAHLQGAVRFGPLLLWCSFPARYLLAMLALTVTRSSGSPHRSILGRISLLSVSLGILVIMVAHPTWALLSAVVVGSFAALRGAVCAMSRAGEYAADQYAAECGFGAGLISYLTFWADAEDAVDERQGYSWFSSHPPLRDRIARIEEMHSQALA